MIFSGIVSSATDLFTCYELPVYSRFGFFAMINIGLFVSYLKGFFSFYFDFFVCNFFLVFGVFACMKDV